MRLQFYSLTVQRFDTTGYAAISVGMRGQKVNQVSRAQLKACFLCVFLHPKSFNWPVMHEQ
jgi:hypothetical protein